MTVAAVVRLCACDHVHGEAAVVVAVVVAGTAGGVGVVMGYGASAAMAAAVAGAVAVVEKSRKEGRAVEVVPDHPYWGGHRDCRNSLSGRCLPDAAWAALVAAAGSAHQ